VLNGMRERIALNEGWSAFNKGLASHRSRLSCHWDDPALGPSASHSNGAAPGSATTANDVAAERLGQTKPESRC